MRASLLDPADPRWTRVLERVRHDVYHRPEYAEVCAEHEGGTAAALLVEDGRDALLAPLLLRRLPEHLDAPDDWRDAVSPYGYASPVVAAGDPAGAFRRLLPALRDEAGRRNLISIFLRLHPLLPPAARPPDGLGRVVVHGPTVVIDLTLPEAELWRQTRPNHRSGIRRLRRDGYEAALDAWEHYPDFIALYRRTMERVGAAAYYLFPNRYFDRLRSALGPRLHLGVVRSPDGEVACAGLFTACGGIVQYHLGGTADAHLGRAPSKLLFHHVRGWAREAGHRAFHLGGGVGAREDSLFRFKAGFSKVRASYATCRLIVDPRRYAALVERAARGRPDVVDTDFFPGYRG